MTYRRLFLILLAVSTLVLAGAWWHSFRNLWLFSAGSNKPPFSLFAGLINANISLYLDGTPQSGWDHRFTSLPLIDGGPLYGALIPVYQERSGLFGGFRWFDNSEDNPGGLSSAVCMVFPVWIPWILFVGGSFVFCRVMERRSGRVKEKELAEKSAKGRLEEEPD